MARTRTSVPLSEFLRQNLQERVRFHSVYVIRAFELVKHSDKVSESASTEAEASFLLCAMCVKAQYERHNTYRIENANGAEGPLFDITPLRQLPVEEELRALTMLFIEAP